MLNNYCDDNRGLISQQSSSYIHLFCLQWVLLQTSRNLNPINNLTNSTLTTV